MPFLDTLRAALAEPPKTSLRQPDPYHVIRLARRRRRRRMIGMAVAAVVLVAVGSIGLRRITTVDGLDVVSASSSTVGISSSSATPVAATATHAAQSLPADSATTAAPPDPVDTTATVRTPTLSGHNSAGGMGVESMSAPHIRLPADHPAGTFLCKGAQSTEQVVLDPSTTQRLQTVGSMVLMDLSVVRLSDDGSGYVSVGPTLTDMSITFGDITVMDPRS